MSVLRERKDLKTIYLPSSKKDVAGNEVPIEQQDYVVMNVGPETGADLDYLDSQDSTGVTIKKKVLNRLTDWSFTDETGNKLPITFETMSLMDGIDIFFLNHQIGTSVKQGGLTAEEKKESPSI